ncbi:MAG TPA: hypothetical protein VFH99_02435 [Candidatus Saccharimonadales bacterium]|nr:hypothetical protein [Candidatus Saccharimonadales bacterium]
MREGNTDISLKIILERHAVSRGCSLIYNEELSKPFNGPLSKVALRIRTKKNFDSGDVDMAFYFADRDKGDYDKLEYIQQEIGAVNGAYLLRSIVGIPDPHMEAWLLADENAVKRVFGIAGEQPVPFANLPPKDRLNALSNKAGDTELTPPIARRKLAKSCNLNLVERRNRSYNQFIGRYNDFLNSLAE